MRLNTFAAIVLIVGTGTAALGGDWAAFRGTAGTGISSAVNVPQTWGPQQNIKWKAPLPGPGNSSPIVSRDRVFVTCATELGRRRSLFCFNRSDGKQLWVQTVDYDIPDPTHKTNPYCGSSPAADGERVVVWHGSAGVRCYDYDGKELWARDLGKFTQIWGYGSSPVFYGAAVILNCGPGVRTFVIALDRKTGKTLWQADEPGGASGEEAEAQGTEKPLWVGSWSTPLITNVAGADQILVSFPHRVNAYDPQSGKVLWTVRGLGDLVYTSVLVGAGKGAAFGGFHGPAIGFRLGGAGDMTDANRLWLSEKKNPQRIGSGVILGNHIFLANAIPATAQCLDLDTGAERWQARLPGGEIWGSIVAAEGRLYVTNPEGKTYIFAANPDKFELLGTNDLGEPSNSTPAFADGEIFFRTFEHVFCIAGTR